jgi:hypothetical protein
MPTTMRAPLLLALTLSGCPTAGGTDTDTDTDAGTTTDAGGARQVELDADGCALQCIEDVDLATPKVESDCTVCDHDPVEHTCAALPACDEFLGEWEPPLGETACFAVRTDDGSQTPSPLDDLGQACLDRGSNAQIFVLRAGEPPAGTELAVACTWSKSPSMACPGLTPG